MGKINIAIIGSGISGLSCAWYLSKKFAVDLYEKNDYFGGHSNTHSFKVNGKEINVDTGFIVFNELNYPNLCKFFESLNVKSYESDMSFSVSMNNGKLEYSGKSALSLFAQKKNLLNLKFLKMLYEILRFYKEVENDRLNYKNISISEYLEIKKYSNYFKNNHLYPMAASIWSSPVNRISKYPFKEFVSFFSNHGLLRIFDRPKWRTVYGGSKEYVKKVLNNKNIKSFKNINVKIERKKGKWELSGKDNSKQYDHVVLCVHSNQVKQVIQDVKYNHSNIFSGIKYNKNNVYLHSDESLMPKNKKAWASWNYVESKSQLSVTYWMNLLQDLKTNKNYFVSLNPIKIPKQKKIEKVIIYEHPAYDLQTFKSQKEVELIQGFNNIWFCGAYLGYGFHEDGIKSGKRVASEIMRKF